MSKEERSWRDKVHPAFLEIAEMYREHVISLQGLRKEPTPQQVQQIRARAVEKLMEIRRSYPDMPADVYSIISVGPPDLPIEEIVKNLPGSLARGLLEWICWKRYRRPLYQLALEDAAGMRESSKKMERLISDGNKLRYGEKLSGFKIDLDHTGLLEMALPLGLDKLTAEELADCFEEVCPCRKAHDADALKKQRARLLKALEAAKAWQKSQPKPVLDYIERKKGQNPTILNKGSTSR